VDSTAEGVGRSQVVPYVVRLAERGVSITLHSFEKHAPDPDVATRLAAAGAAWRPHPFRVRGGTGGLLRIGEGARLVRGAALVHARSDLAAASCVVARARHWLWDMRSLWREERMAAGMLRAGSVEERVLRHVERTAARTSTAVVTLSAAAIEVLRCRFGEAVAAKSRLITTCVDLRRFTESRFPPPDPLRFLLAGTLSPVYDVATMVRLVERVAKTRPTELTVLTPDAGWWRGEFERIGATVGSAPVAAMPDRVAAHHVGLSMRHLDISNRAATPTKLGEFLAAGRPVVVSPGLGDMDALVARHRCGVVVADVTDAGLDRSAEEIARLVDDPDTPHRCRAAAEAYFDLDRGVDELIAAYRAALA
jgi:hypothetical protein